MGDFFILIITSVIIWFISRNIGYKKGMRDCDEQRYNEGYSEGYNEGYNEGYKNGLNEGSDLVKK